MANEFTTRRRIITAGLALLLAADAALIIYSVRLASTPRMRQQDLAQESDRIKMLKADVDRAAGIQRGLPQTKQDCEKFEAALLPATAGYSTVTDEIGTLARKANLQVAGINFRQKQIENRDLAEISIETGVTGEYGNVVKFLNSLQRSKDIYAVESLTAQPDAQAAGAPGGQVRVMLRMKTYFRNA